MDNNNNLQQESMLLVGTILRGIYRIDSYLSSGGFGNTYVATNIEFNERYAIKEFFMKGVTQRDGDSSTVSVSNSINQESFLQQKEKFKKEARRLRQLNNPHIVKVHDLFEENGTAYYVMDYVDGENLNTRLKRTGKPMSEEEVCKILPQILDALQTVHDAGIWHLDLKPANIMVDKAGQVKLIDFGASKQLNTQKGGATTSTAISYTNGFAPREQMEQNYDKFGPWTDLYALGATLYNLLTNQRPPLPTDIDDDMSDDKHLALPMPNVSDKMKQLILWLMKTNRMQRPKTIKVVKDFKFEEKPKEVDPKDVHEPAVKDSEDDKTKIARKKEDIELKAQTSPLDDAINLVNSQDSNKSLFDNFTVPINKVWITLALVLSILCLIGILSPLIVSTWGEYLPVHEDWVLWGFESDECFSSYYFSASLFHMIKVFMLVLLCIGFRKYSKAISYVSMLCVSFEMVISIVLFYNYWGPSLIDIDFISYYIFIAYFVLGIFIIRNFSGNAAKFGLFLPIYSVISIVFSVAQGTTFGFLGYWIEITWIIAMWWVLTRKEVVNESY